MGTCIRTTGFLLLPGEFFTTGCLSSQVFYFHLLGSFPPKKNVWRLIFGDKFQSYLWVELRWVPNLLPEEVLAQKEAGRGYLAE